MPLEVGNIVEGKVTGLTTFGAFVSLPDGGTGMVHISEVASSYVKDIKEHLKEEQVVKCKVLSIGEDGKISLSIKRALESEENKENRDKGKRTSFKPKNQNVWQGVSETSKSSNMSFEDMMQRFKQVSDEKMSDLKRSSEMKQGSGGYRRGSK